MLNRSYTRKMVGKLSFPNLCVNPFKLLPVNRSDVASDQAPDYLSLVLIYLCKSGANVISIYNLRFCLALKYYQKRGVRPDSRMGAKHRFGF